MKVATKTAGDSKPLSYHYREIEANLGMEPFDVVSFQKDIGAFVEMLGSCAKTSALEWFGNEERPATRVGFAGCSPEIAEELKKLHTPIANNQGFKETTKKSGISPSKEHIEVAQTECQMHRE